MSKKIVFDYLLYHATKTNDKGACYKLAAVLFVLFSELGLQPKLMIGEVSGPEGILFDHSWVELEDNVYDIALSLPRGLDEEDDRLRYFEAIFDSIGYRSQQSPPFVFGTPHPHLEAVTQKVYSQTLGEYEISERGDLWDLAVYVGNICRLPLNKVDIIQKYQHIKRELKLTT